MRCDDLSARAARIRAQRQRARIAPHELARAAGVPTRRLLLWETVPASIPRRAEHAIADELGVTADWLRLGDDGMNAALPAPQWLRNALVQELLADLNVVRRLRAEPHHRRTHTGQARRRGAGRPRGRKAVRSCARSGSSGESAAGDSDPARPRSRARWETKGAIA